MNIRLRFLLAGAALLPGLLFAQDTASPATDIPPESGPKLTETQVATIMKQLTELETQIQKLRGDNLGTILQRLRTAAASNPAALNFYLECDKVVNSERKEADRADARRREENMERNLDRKGGDRNGADEGDFALAVKLQIQYIILTLEAHETSDKDLPKMVPKLQTHIQELVAAAPKLRGRALGYLRGSLTGSRNPIVEALQLERYLEREHWSQRPADIGEIYDETILALAEESNKDSLPGLYDARINAEGNFRKETMFAPEYALWMQNELPVLRWERARYLFEKGPEPVTAMADMLRLIKEHPGHASSPQWLQELRDMVAAAKPLPVGFNPERPAGS